MEREVLWKNAPHIIWPMRFVLPVKDSLRPAWLVRLGLFLYDHIGGRKLLPATRTLDLRHDPAGQALQPGFGKAFEYSDCWVMDARLVVLNARDAAVRGATIATRTRVTSALPGADGWQVTLHDERSGQTLQVRARMLVNAAGPWIDHVIANVGGRNDAHNVRLVQGSHIVVRRKFEGERAYFFQNRDGRIIFAIPYEDEFTLIGTTDRDYTGEPHDVAISGEEIDYLCEAASEYFAEPVRREDVVWTYSGVRPLFDDGASKAQEATRDYVLKLDGTKSAPIANVFGGKITTYRRLAESMLDIIEGAIGSKGPAWTRDAALPGGGFAATAFAAELTRLEGDYPFLPAALARRLLRHYGLDAREMLGQSRRVEDLGQDFGADVYDAELRHAARLEWAQTGADFLWRRTKLGLRLSEEQRAAVDARMRQLAG